MKKLSEKQWLPVIISDIAKIKSGKDIYAKERVRGKTPYITSGSSNNGIGYFVKNNNNSLDRNVLSVNRNGAVGQSFYHPYKALFGNDSRRLILNNQNNQFVYLFVSQSITMQKEAFSYSRKLGTSRLKSLHIMLPMTKSNNPDYPYMKQYLKLVKEKLINRYKSFLQAQLTLLKHVDIPELSEARWKPFRIDDIFDEIASGKIKSVKKLISQENGISLLGATNRNNGIVDNISRMSFDNKKIQSGNCIAFVQTGEGSVGYATYQPKSFISSGNANYGYASWLNPFTGLFFVTSQNKLRLKYNYGYIRSKNRLQADKVMLPVDRFNKPDYQYMEQYVKNLMLQKYQQYLVFLNN